MAERLNIAREVAALKRMTVKELRGRYVEVFGEATRTQHRQRHVRAPRDLRDGQDPRLGCDRRPR